MFGLGCNQTCSCGSNGVCDPRDGNCHCLAGWQGCKCKLHAHCTCLPGCLSVQPRVCLSVSVCPSASLSSILLCSSHISSVYPPAHPSIYVCLTVCPFVRLPVCLSCCLSGCLSRYVNVFLSVSSSVRPPLCPFQSVRSRLFVYPSVSVCLSGCTPLSCLSVRS